MGTALKSDRIPGAWSVRASAPVRKAGLAVLDGLVKPFFVILLCVAGLILESLIEFPFIFAMTIDERIKAYRPPVARRR